MEKITNKKILNIFTLCIIIVLPFITNVSFYLQIKGILNSYSSVNPSIIIWISIPFLLYVYIKDIIDKKRKLDIYDYIFYCLVIVGIIVSIFSINPRISLLGIESRREGFLSLLGYYLLFVNWKENGNSSDAKRYMKIFIAMGIISSIYSLLQIYSSSNFVLRYTLDKKMASGLYGNPNFFATFMVFLLGILATKFLTEEKIKKK